MGAGSSIPATDGEALSQGYTNGEIAAFRAAAARLKSCRSRRVVVCTDIGNFSDDFWALALLLSDPSVEVPMILTSGGDTDAKVKILSKFLTHCGRSSVPIGVGPSSAEMPFLAPDEEGHLLPAATEVPNAVGNPIMGEWAASWDPKSAGTVVHADGITAMSEILRAPGVPPVVMLVLGTMENVGHMLAQDSDLLQRTQTRVVSMGGTLTGELEYNYMLQPESTRMVFASCNSVTVVPVEICRDSRMSLGSLTERSSYSTYLNGDSRIAMALAQVQLALANYGTHKEVAQGSTDILFDSVAMFVGLGFLEELYIKEEMVVKLSDKGRLEKSTTEDGGAQITVVKSWANDRADDTFRDFLAKAVAAGDTVLALKGADEHSSSVCPKPPTASVPLE